MGMRWVMVMVGATALAGCSPMWYKQDADREVHDILKAKAKDLLSDVDRLTLDPDPTSRLYDPDEPVVEARPTTTQPAPFVRLLSGGPLTMNDALILAVVNSREYQQRKEDLYLAALRLTGERHLYSPRLTGTSSAEFRRDRADDVAGRVDSDLSVSKLLAGGGQIVLGISHRLVRSFRGFPVTQGASSLLALDIIQPLLQGAGREVELENLTQAERDVVYAARDFARFQKTFAVRVASAYARLLQQYDTEANQKANYERLVKFRKMSERLKEMNRLNQIQLDQAIQDELEAENRWVDAQEETQNRLDSLKLLLGLQTDVALIVDIGGLKRFPQPTRDQPLPDLSQSVAKALGKRLDLQVRREQVDDLRRKTVVAADLLRAELNLVGEARVGSSQLKSLRFDFDGRGEYAVGVDLDLPLDRKLQRNAYRESLIDLHRGKRALMELADNVRLQVRTAHRGLGQARQSYFIQQQAKALAERRVQSANAFRDAGRASTRDLLEAQRALVNAQNALTRALIDYYIAKLEYHRDVGTLRVHSKGIDFHEPVEEPTDNR